VLLTITQYADTIPKDTPWSAKIIAAIVFIIGAPIFCAYAALTDLLDYIIPGGWDDNDDEFKQ
jgi:hypothetical protein